MSSPEASLLLFFSMYIIAQLYKNAIAQRFKFLFFLKVLDIFIKTEMNCVSAAIEKNNLLPVPLSSIMKRYEYISNIISFE